MEIGVPREVRQCEYRVGLTPGGVDALSKDGHVVYVEAGAGQRAGFADDNYWAVGATMLYSAEEVWRRSGLIVKIAQLVSEEYVFLQGQVLLCFLHLAVGSPLFVRALRDTGATAIAAEMIHENGVFPVLHPTSEVAGRLAPVIAGQLLQTMVHNIPGPEPDGRGMLLSGLPGIPPANVVILGAGVVGTNAARSFLGMGSQVTMLDRDLDQLRRVDQTTDGRVVTMAASPFNVAKALTYADVLIGAVYVAGQRAPVLVTRGMVRTMRPRAVIIDFAIDQGGCVETSRPTSLRDPFFIDEDVIHYCVPNVPAAVARTSSYAWGNAVLPYVATIAERGLDEALLTIPGLRHGLVVYRGDIREPERVA